MRGCRTERASSHLFPLLYSSLNGEANQTTWIWAPQTDKRAHTYTPSARAAKYTTPLYVTNAWACLHVRVCVCVCVYVCGGGAWFFFSTFQQNKVGCEPRLWDLDERRSLDGTWLRDMFFRQNRTWHLLRQNLIKLKQNTAIVARCVLCVCHVWNGTVQKRYGLVSAQHHQRAGFSLIYTQPLTNDRCVQWCLKHFYEAVGVIKNVYYDGAEAGWKNVIDYQLLF